MLKLKITKKGISPLIATILLVAVSLALAGILYSWASHNASNTVSSVTDGQQQRIECSAINLFIEEGCSYDANTGINLIISDYSSVNIDENIEITVVDIDNRSKTASIPSNFQGGIMAVNSSVLSDPTALNGLGKIQRVYVFIKRCPERKATTMSCD